MKKIVQMAAACMMLVALTGCQTQTKEEALTIYMVRHGKTFFNTTGQVQGFADSPLTENGKEKALQLGEGMKDITFDLAYSSDLGRQRNTLKLILSKNEHDIPEMKEHDGFKEWNYGGFEGKTDIEMWTPIFESNGLQLDENWTDYPKLVEKLGDKGIADAIAKLDELGAAESYDQIVARGTQAMDMVIQDAKETNSKTAIIVSSGSMIPTILEIVTPGQYHGESIDNCSVSVLKYQDGKYTLETIGSDEYLK